MSENLILGLLAASLLFPAALMVATGAPILSALLGAVLLLPVSLPLAAIMGGLLSQLQGQTDLLMFPALTREMASDHVR